MKPSVLFVVLTWLLSLGGALGGWFGYMKDATCDTIKDQLQGIIFKITEMEANQTTIYPTPKRLKLFLQHYDQSIINEKRYKDEMRDFVHAKLNEFSIPVVGLQDDASQLEKVFLHVADRKDFYEKLLAQQTEEYKDLQEEKVNLEKAIIEKERNINASKGYIKDMEGKINQEQQKKQQLEAKINGNPPVIQG